MSNFNKIEIDYDLYSTMRYICLEIVLQAELVNDHDDENGCYRREPYGGDIVFITDEELKQLKQLYEI